MIFPIGSVVIDKTTEYKGMVLGYHKNISSYEVSFIIRAKNLMLEELNPPLEDGVYSFSCVSSEINFARKMDSVWYLFGTETVKPWPPFESILEYRKID